VYEDKRAESNRIMEETDAKREKIDELLETIEARLNELEAEKQELKSFQKLDRDRRCLEYALAYKDQEDATNQLERAEEDKNNEFHMMNERNKDFYDLEARIQTLESELTEHKHTLSNESTSLQQFEAEMNSLVRAKAEVECVIDDYKQSSEGSEASHRAATKELARIEERVAAASKRLDELTADMEARAEAERDAKKQLESTQSKLRVLYDKQGRARHFDSKAARDAYLMEEIKSIDANEKEQKTSVTSLDKDVGEAKARLDELTAKSAKEQEDENDSRARLEQMSNDLSTLRTDFDEMTKQKK
jgi:structural maintenance of chromosome 3 (chondroitin sulfate proteoglycan 6)